MKNQLWRWQKGRQNKSYHKMLLGTSMFPIPWDMYLIHYPPGSEIAPHQDKVEKGSHYRLNWIIWNATIGGEFLCQNTLFATQRIKLFRPDKEIHSVTQIQKGHRWVLSLGWVKGAKKIKPAS